MMSVDETQGQRIIEALLLAFGHPLALKRIAEVIPDLGSARIRGGIERLNAEYAASGRSFRIQEVAGGYQLVTDQAFAPWIRQALQQPRPDSVSSAALETLAIIAYRQPVTKAEIEAIRGVDVTASLETLIERRFVRMAGRQDTPGRPFLYGTTTEFLRHFGLKSLDALPSVQFPAITETAAPAPAPAAAAPREPVPGLGAQPATDAGTPAALRGHARRQELDEGRPEAAGGGTPRAASASLHGQ